MVQPETLDLFYIFLSLSPQQSNSKTTSWVSSSSETFSEEENVPSFLRPHFCLSLNSVCPCDVSTALELISALSSLSSSKFSLCYGKIYFLKTQTQWQYSLYGMRPSASLFVSSLIPTTSKAIFCSDLSTLLAKGSISSRTFQFLFPISASQNTFLLCSVESPTQLSVKIGTYIHSFSQKIKKSNNKKRWHNYSLFLWDFLVLFPTAPSPALGWIRHFPSWFNTIPRLVYVSDLHTHMYYVCIIWHLRYYSGITDLLMCSLPLREEISFTSFLYSPNTQHVLDLHLFS